MSCPNCTTLGKRCPACALEVKRAKAREYARTHPKPYVKKETRKRDIEVIREPATSNAYLDKFKGIDGYNYGKQVAAMRDIDT